jgi:hypothetical protein
MFFSFAEIKTHFLNLLMMFVLGGFVAALLFSFSPRKEGFESEGEGEMEIEDEEKRKLDNDTLENFYDSDAVVLDSDEYENYGGEENYENYDGQDYENNGGEENYEMPDAI